MPERLARYRRGGHHTSGVCACVLLLVALGAAGCLTFDYDVDEVTIGAVRCGPEVCAEGLVCCGEGDAARCVDALRDATSCGVCGRACGSGEVCVEGACTCGATASTTDTACLEDERCCDGACALIAVSVLHCGGCGEACEAPNTESACAAGVCQYACAGGFIACGDTVASGCLVDPMTDPNHCGGCGARCGQGAACVAGACVCGDDACWMQGEHHTAAACSDGVCELSCRQGRADCDSQGATGCEVDTDADPTSCGRCDNVCDDTNGTPACQGGVCAIACAQGFDDCNDNPLDGCEAQLAVSLDHCGACSAACADGAQCVAGACACGAEACSSREGDACVQGACACGGGAPCSPGSRCASGTCIID